MSRTAPASREYKAVSVSHGFVSKYLCDYYWPGKRLAPVSFKTEEFTKRLSRNKNEESNSRCRVMEGFLEAARGPGLRE